MLQSLSAGRSVCPSSTSLCYVLSKFIQFHRKQHSLAYHCISRFKHLAQQRELNVPARGLSCAPLPHHIKISQEILYGVWCQIEDSHNLTSFPPQNGMDCRSWSGANGRRWLRQRFIKREHNTHNPTAVTLCAASHVGSKSVLLYTS